MVWKNKRKEKKSLGKGIHRWLREKGGGQDLESGLLTVEATLALSFFCLAMLSWILLIHSLEIISISKHALDQAALEMSDRISFFHTLKDGDKLGDFFPKLEKQKEEDLAGKLDSEVTHFGMEFSSRRLYLKNFAHGGPLPKAISHFDLTSDVDDERDRLHLTLRYQLDLPGILRPLGPLDLVQETTAGLWLLTEEPVKLGLEEGGEGREEDKDKDKDSEESVWAKPPFTRGRILVERLRQRSPGRRVKKGQVFDLLYGDGSAQALYSIHLFSSSYSRGQGEEASKYQLKKEALHKLFRAKAKDLKKRLGEKNSLLLENGSMAASNGKVRLGIILPLEAQAFTKDLDALARQLAQEEGVRLDFYFEEKAWIKEEKDAG